jgi:hypothetical protein
MCLDIAKDFQNFLFQKFNQLIAYIQNMLSYKIVAKLQSWTWMVAWKVSEQQD